MTLDTFDPDQPSRSGGPEPDHAEMIALLQPFVDGELTDHERALVADQIAHNPEYQAIVRQQLEVRAALRTLPREVASASLRARVLADLDGVDAERARSWSAPVVGRIKAFGRGAMLMVPAAAAAVVLFVIANGSGWLAGPELVGGHIDGGMSNSIALRSNHTPSASPETAADVGAPESDSESDKPSRERAVELDPSLPNPLELGDELGFAVQIAPQRSLPDGVALVSDDPSSASSSAMVRYRDSGGAVMVDRQRRAGVAELRGTQQVFRDHDYHLGRDEQGRPRVEFQVGRVHHSLVLEGSAQASVSGSVGGPEFERLLIVADALRLAHER